MLGTLLMKLSIMRANTLKAYENIIGKLSKTYYEGILKAYADKFDKVSVREYCMKELGEKGAKLGEVLMCMWEAQEGLAVDEVSVFQVLIHGYGLDRLRLEVEPPAEWVVEELLLKEEGGMNRLRLSLVQKLSRLSVESGHQILRLGEPVTSINNKIGSLVEVVTSKAVYQCFTVLTSSSLHGVPISQLSSTRRLLLDNLKRIDLLRLQLVFKTAFWRARFSGSIMCGPGLPISEIFDVSPQNLSCGILAVTVCGSKIAAWLAKEKKVPKSIKEEMRTLIAHAFLEGNEGASELEGMEVRSQSRDQIGAHLTLGAYTRIATSNESYLECCSRDEHNLIFLGSGHQLASAWALSLESSIRYARQRALQCLGKSDP